MNVPEKLQVLWAAVLGEHSDQALTPAERSAIARRTAGHGGLVLEGGEVAAGLQAFVDRLAQHAYRITEEELAGLQRAGCSEEQIFEATVAGALGAAWARLHAGLRAMERP
jgi:hypothetical protein